MSVALTLEQEIQKVKELGDQIGYGHMMSLASALWRKMLAEKIGNPNGAFVPTILSLFNKEGKKIAEKTIKHYDTLINP